METQYHQTAGGVVLNRAGEVLLLERRVEREGKRVHEIRLPKGHIDPGESDAAAACREVGEESGYWQVRIDDDLGFAESEFEFQGRHHHRSEHYFLMRLTSDERQGAQPVGAEEALFRPLWRPLAEAESLMSYTSEQDFIRRARCVIKETSAG